MSEIILTLDPNWEPQLVTMYNVTIYPGEQKQIFNSNNPGLLRYAFMLTDSPDIILRILFVQKNGVVKEGNFSARYLTEGGAKGSWSSLADTLIYDTTGGHYAIEIRRNLEPFTRSSQAFLINPTSNTHTIIEFSSEVWLYKPKMKEAKA
jgi:hypothetical protein